VISKPTVICNSWFCKPSKSHPYVAQQLSKQTIVSIISFQMLVAMTWPYKSYEDIMCPLESHAKKHTQWNSQLPLWQHTKWLFGSLNYKSVFRKYVLPSILDKPVLSRYSVIVDLYITVFGSQLLSQVLLWNQITKTQIWSPCKLIIPVKASWYRNQRRCEIYGQRTVLSLWRFL
jgi:hypothetical protein